MLKNKQELERRRYANIHHYLFDSCSDEFFIFAHRVVCIYGLPFHTLARFIKKSSPYESQSKKLKEWVNNNGDLSTLYTYYLMITEEQKLKERKRNCL